MKADTSPDPAVRELVRALVDSAPPAPPFPSAGERSAPSRGPRAALVAFVVLALVVGAIAIVLQHSSPSSHPTNPAAHAPQPAPPAKAESIAYVGSSGLTVVDGSGHARVLVKTAVSNPAWSYDRKWIAYERLESAGPGGARFDLWAVPANGGRPRQLLTDIGQWSWSRTQPNALVAIAEAGGGSHARADVVLADRAWRWTAPVADVTGVAWAHRSGTLVLAHGANPGKLSTADVFDPSRFCLVPCPGPVKPIDFSPIAPSVSVGAEAFDFSLMVDGFTADDRAVLVWLDPLESGSIALDGLGLLSVPITGGTATHLPATLVKPAWIREAPTGTDLLVVRSNGRMVTDERQIDRCDAGGTCDAIVGGVQTMDPAWSPDGSRLAYVRSDASRDPNAFLRGSSSAIEIPDWAARYAQRHLWVADADGTHAHEVPGAGNGVAVLGWSDANHVLAVVGQRVRSVDVATGQSVALTGKLLGDQLPPASVYEATLLNGGPGGFTSWESLVAIRP